MDIVQAGPNIYVIGMVETETSSGLYYTIKNVENQAECFHFLLCCICPKPA